MRPPAACSTALVGESLDDRLQDGPSARRLIDDDDGLRLAGHAERVVPCPHLAQRLHVAHVAVVAEQVASAVRDRPDHRDPRRVGTEWQDPVVLDEHERPFSQRAGRLCLLDDERLDGGRPRDVEVRRLEQPEPELHPEDRDDRPVDQGLVDAAVLEGGQQRRAEAVGPRQFEVHARPEREDRRGGRLGRHPVVRGQHRDARVVGGDDAVEAPFVAQDRREQLHRRMARDAVDVAIGRHDAADPAVADRDLEREQLLVAELARADVGRGLVEPALGQAVPDEVLRGGDDAVVQGVALERRRVGVAHLGGQVRVLAVGLLDPSPARVAGDVEDGRQGVARAGQQHPLADRRGDLPDDGRVEGRGGPDRLLEARRVPGHQPVQALLVDDARDPQAGVLDQVALDVVVGSGDVHGPQVGRAGEAGDLADPVGRERGHPFRIDLPVDDHLEGPDGTELGELLGPGHAREQVGHADLDGLGRVLVGRGDRLHPLTAPAVRPPTSWRSAMT